MTKIIPAFNQAGGVAKSTLTQNLGYHLALQGSRVLLIDLDPQASLTIFMGLEPADLEKTIYNALMSEEGEAIPIHQNLHGMDLAPADILLASAEQELIFTELREFRLKEVLAPYLEQYDFILIDCPPSLGMLSLLALVASTHVLVPIETQFKAFKGTDNLLRTIGKAQQRLNKELKIAGFVPTKHQNRKHNRRVLEAIESQLSPIAPIFSPIPQATAIAEASNQGIPLALYDKSHAIVALFNEIAQALEKL